MSITLGKLDSTVLDDLGTGEPALASKESPGMILSSARKELGWTVEEIATSLNLRVSVIDALEADDYSQLPGATFIRGYLRSYARLTGVDEKEVVITDTILAVPPGIIANAKPVMGASAFRSRRESGSKIWILWVALVILIAVGWSFSGIKLWGPDGLMSSFDRSAAQSGDGSEISLTLDPSSRTGTASE